ncbi:MAG TPA: hypothetical protein VE569_03015 [Acidimicrobiia bacterium]|nr:hypothetical protein [Acidimicrobiia bacterium]
MVGKGRHPILGVRSIDPVLSLVAPIGLAASVGTGLVVDLASEGRRGDRSLRDLAEDGPTLAELSPGRPGVAFLDGAGMAVADAIDILDRLATRWPAVSVRVTGADWPFPVVPVIPLYPGKLMTVREARGVWQPVGTGSTPPGPGPVLPRLRPTHLRRLLSGQLPRRSRWVSAWRPIWELPWA